MPLGASPTRDGAAAILGGVGEEPLDQRGLAGCPALPATHTSEPTATACCLEGRSQIALLRLPPHGVTGDSGDGFTGRARSSGDRVGFSPSEQVHPP